MRSLPRALAAVAAVLVLCDCSTIRHVFHTPNNTSKQAEQLQILQLRTQRYADEYVGSIVAPIRRFQESTDNAVDRLDAQNWMLSQATAAYTIASGPSPYVNVVDLVVLATLSRMVIDDAWVGERFGERAGALRDAYHRLEPAALELAKSAIPPDQIAALQQVIIEWRAQNPQVTAITYVHFRDVANSIGRPAGGGSNSSFSGLFTMLGLDPFSGLDPAVREITQSRELAERTIYYAQRVPNLHDMQVERLTFEFATMPETKRLLADADSVSEAASIAGRVIGEFPGVLAGEREAAIRQFMDSINVETATLRQLTMDVRAALEAGTVTSNSLNATIRSLDQMLAGFQKPAPSGGPAQSPGRPFDITEYTAAAAEITRAATQLQQLIAGIDQGSPALMQAAGQATLKLQDVVDHAYWRIVQLIILLLLGSLGAALTYRGVVGRWRS
ncbi:MAG TPA: hypothetical protein VKH13_07460 [Steroidobacteraceae bacterium]|nr:hypothetical protein [Steroidobacteraceae bacterium]